MAVKEEGRGAFDLVKLIGFGAVTLSLYIALFKYEDFVLSLAKQGRWAFIFPVVVAFLVSIFHGGFTSRFWDYLGVKAKK